MESITDYKNALRDYQNDLETLKETLKISSLREKIKDLDEEMLKEGFWDDNEKATAIIDEANGYKSVLEDYEQLDNLLAEIDAGIELLEELDDEGLRTETRSMIKKAKKDLDSLTLSTYLSGKYDKEDAILSINAGAGGTEAQDWAGILYRMYTRYAEHQGYNVEVLDILKDDEAGISSATLKISGTNAYGYLKSEKGVHRLVRISPFDSGGRRHTSFASVDVYPNLDTQVAVDINEEDLRIDTYRSSGAGGQHVNVTDSAVRITHIPTGVVVQCQNERSQTQNREQAMKMLHSRLLAIAEQERKDEIADIQGDYSQIAWGSQIRSYVLHPYTMVKDHRTDLEKGDAERVLDGDIQDFIEESLKYIKNN